MTAHAKGAVASFRDCAQCLSLSLLALTLPAEAHHSAAMFDAERTVTLTGTVRDFQWASPHCWIQLIVPQAQGSAEWSIEMGAPDQLMRHGWRKTTLKSGDKAVLTIHPLRDGGKGGELISAARGDGSPFVAEP